MSKSNFGQPIHDPGPREGLGQKYGLGIVLLDLANQPFPEGKRLGVRIVHPENPDAVFNPEVYDAQKLLPEVLPVVVFKIKRINILILFGRIFPSSRASRTMDMPSA